MAEEVFRTFFAQVHITSLLT